jgi:general secretion pathway protein B
MSFILDALKKSEAERQRKSVPGFADIPDARSEQRSQRWWWIIGGLLTVNAAVLLGVFFMPDANDATEAAPVQHAALSRPPVSESLPATATSKPFAEIVAEAKKNRPPQDVPTTTEPQRRDSTPAAAPATSRVTMSEQLATINEVRAEGSLQLPELHLDIHVYSEKPAERFVFINMAKYKEGDTLSEGPAIREIRTDGVVLEQSGTRFLMPRQ